MTKMTTGRRRRNHYAGAIWLRGIAIPLAILGVVWIGLSILVEEGRREARAREARYMEHLDNLAFAEGEAPKLRADAGRYEWLRRGAAPDGGERVRRHFEAAVAKVPNGALTRRRFGENADPFPGGSPFMGAAALGVLPEFSGRMAAFQAVAIDVEFAIPSLFLQRLTMTPGSENAEIVGVGDVVFAPEYIVFGEDQSE